ncbi:glycosyltransferase family 2 protein [Xanthocytophaga agilis]|uniref:Glycosyltransferase family 2 protein n=1 Tax=Xanthocytophaga agilis TaxID=3048010 RepID=A0AAE3R2A2_9BACT|nr:glycosyltransferase family 2 protein [Xanthocytophaga agilis]MDJ1502526.1 glycosyltransferase family 2 protein [Xanthocytophaga agilis]
MKTAVVILNYNGKHFLEQFLPSVVQYTTEAQIIVADNLSTDGSVEMLQQKFPQVQIIENTHNEGYAGGYNSSLKQVQAEYYVLLNSDVEVTPQWLSPLIQLMDSNPTIAACQPKLKQFHQKTHFEYAGAAGGFIDILGYPFCRGRIFQEMEADTDQYNDTRPVFWASGACMVVRSSIFWELNGLDAAFFAHMEEIDFCWRAHNSGYQIYYCAESTVYHVGAGTLSNSNPQKTFLNFRNSLATLYKNLHTFRLIYTIFIRLVLDGVAGAIFLLQKKPTHCWAIVRAHFDFYKKIPFWMKQRQNVIRKKDGFDLLVYQSSIVWMHFVRKKKKFSELQF